MSNNIATMNVKQLRDEVQLLRDELAIMKRKYEDILYNLDDDNFSSKIIKEKGNMKTAIEVNAEGIKTKVSSEDLNKSLSNYSTITQTAEKIEIAVNSVNNSTDEKLKNYSTFAQTAEQISATVTKEYVTDLVEGEYVTNATFKSQFDIYANGIYASVERTYETKSDAADAYNDLSSYISRVEIEADNISTRVGKVEKGKYGSYTLFTQSADTFLFDGDKAVFTGCIYVTDNADNKAFSIFLNEGANYDAFYMWGYGNYDTAPVIIGNSYGNGVYIGSYTDDDRVATRAWVLEQMSY